MIIRNTNFYSRNSFIKNINSNQSKNNSQIANVVKKNVNKDSKDVINQKIKVMTTELKNTENSEQKLKDKMSVLKEKEINLNKMNDIGTQLKDLSKQYKSDSSEMGAAKIESKAMDLLNDLNTLMDKNVTKESNIVEDKLFKLNNSDGKISIIFTKGVDTNQNLAKINNTNITTKDVNSSIKVSIKDLLEKPSIIEENILNPIQTSLKNVNESKSIVFSDFIKDYTAATNSIDELYKLGALDSDKKDAAMKHQKSIYESICKSYY